MREVRETTLPGVGVRHEFETEGGRTVGVIVHRDGRREVVAYGTDDPDACSTLLELSAQDAHLVSEMLGGTQVTETAGAVQQSVAGLVIEWINVEPDSPAAGRTILDGQYRTRTGASIVAVIRGDQPVPAPGPEFALAADDIAVAVGTVDGLTALRTLLAT